MYLPCSTSPALVARARADQVATLFAHVHLTTLSMGLAALILCAAMWGQQSAGTMAVWCSLIALNQAWRTRLAHGYTRVRPGFEAAPRWGRYWAIGSTTAGALWGLAAIAMFPQSPAYQALLIVCLFGVALGGLYLTAVYKPSLYGFILTALAPLVIRVALVGDPVHVFIAGVMAVVLGFLLGFGHRLNDVMTRSLVIRYENVDLIAELKQRTRIAQDARAAAESANRAKSQLLAAASHDLRQPLHALGLYVAALSARTRGAEWHGLVANVEKAANALETQFGQLIDLSRLDAGVLTPDRGSIELAGLFDRIATEFAPQAAAKGIALRIAPSTLSVDSDAGLLERIVDNLVANAIRYTRDGGVLIGARRCGMRVAIDVVDTGVGIAPGHRDRIFEEFYQIGDRSGAPSSGHGMGLGLAIVRRFADLLGHTIELRSVPGAGSRFRVLAPRDQNVRPRAQSAAPTGLVPKGVTQYGTAPSRLADCVVAVIDDDAATVDAMSTLFETWGATVVGAHTLDALLVHIGALERYPDLVVADLRLADGESGIRAVRALRSELGYPVPAIIVSGDTGTRADREARAAGLPLLEKPVVAATLEAAAMSTLRRYGHLRPDMADPTPASPAAARTAGAAASSCATGPSARAAAGLRS